MTKIISDKNSHDNASPQLLIIRLWPSNTTLSEDNTLIWIGLINRYKTPHHHLTLSHHESKKPALQDEAIFNNTHLLLPDLGTLQRRIIQIQQKTGVNQTDMKTWDRKLLLIR